MRAAFNGAELQNFKLLTLFVDNSVEKSCLLALSDCCKGAFLNCSRFERIKKKSLFTMSYEFQSGRAIALHSIQPAI